MKKFQRGIGLVEILVAVAMLGGIVLLISGLNQNATKVASNLEVNSDILELTQEIQGVLSKPNNCLTTLVGRNAIHAPNTVQVLKKEIKTGFEDVFPANGLNPHKVYGSKRLKIFSYSLSDAAPEVAAQTHGTTHLIVDFYRGKNGNQTETISKKILLNVKVDGGGNITSCAAASTKKNDIWKYATNNTDIYYSSGAVGVGTNSPTHNLTILAQTFPHGSGMSIHGNESAASGWHRAGLSVRDQTSDWFWSMSIFGSSSSEGGGNFGIGGGPTTTTGMNRLIITKGGDVGINTNLVPPSCGLPPCNFGRFLHVHSNKSGDADASQMVFSSSLTGENVITGGLAFSASQSSAPDRRVAVITGNTSSPAGSPLKGSMLFWTNNNGANNYNGVLSAEGNFWARGTLDTAKMNTVSDQKFKKDIRPLTHSLEKILELKPSRFEWKDSDDIGEKIGLIAQDVEKVFPEVVKTDAKGFKSISYAQLVAPAVEAFKALVTSHREQLKEFKSLEKENLMLKMYVCKQYPKEKICQSVNL